jgi:hypothetical protein
MALLYGGILGLCFGQETTRASYLVKHASSEAVYLDGGSNDGLSIGEILSIRKAIDSPEIAQIEIESVTPHSAAGKILTAGAAVIPGDIALLSTEEMQKQKQSDDAKKYPQTISFTQGNPLDEEVRESLPRRPMPEINRVRGRVGFDFGYMRQDGGISSSLYGITARVDATRLGGTYWNLRGYYRGYLHSRGGGNKRPMLVDLVNRTYHLGFTYDNPNSHWVAGAGRLLVPWASSLDTLDGFYLGRRYGRATFGIFAGSAPDPTSWNYNPNRQMGGSFVNFEGGSFDSLRLSSTVGIGLTRVGWHPDRQFAFFQNGFSYKRYLSIYSDMQADLINPIRNSSDLIQGKRELALSKSYLTVRLQPLKRLSFDISHNYFRNIPTFDERLLSTGLLDKYLFQGLSGGFRLDLPYKFAIYSTIGRSSRSDDKKPSWDYLTGISVSDIMHTGIRTDARYSRFDSSFGHGIYRSLSIARDLSTTLQLDAQVGQQDVTSSLNSRTRSRFINGNLNWMVGSRFYLGAGMAIYRGGAQNYSQWYGTLGYRFDNRNSKRHD